MDDPVRQTASGCFHSFGGCFGIVAAAITMFVGCAFLASLAHQNDVVERNLKGNKEPTKQAANTPVLKNTFVLGADIDCAADADKQDFLRRKRDGDDAELFIERGTTIEAVAEDKPNGLILVRRLNKQTRFWVFAEDIKSFR